MKKLFLLIIILLGIMITGCTNTDGATGKETVITVSAAASVQEALTDIAELFEENNPRIKIQFNFGSSGALQQQITQGAPVDLYFSAAKDTFDQLIKEGFIDKQDGVDIIGNEVVMIVPKHSSHQITSIKDIINVDSLSIGIPETVPAGKYAKETLQYLELWEKIKNEISVIEAKDVRQVLTYVETENVDAGFVYKTDALSSSKVRIAAIADENTHTPIIYPVGIIKNSPSRKEAHIFMKFLQSKEAKLLFHQYGFKTDL